MERLYTITPEFHHLEAQILKVAAEKALPSLVDEESKEQLEEVYRNIGDSGLTLPMSTESISDLAFDIGGHQSQLHPRLEDFALSYTNRIGVKVGRIIGFAALTVEDMVTANNAHEMLRREHGIIGKHAAFWLRRYINIYEQYIVARLTAPTDR